MPRPIVHSIAALTIAVAIVCVARLNAPLSAGKDDGLGAVPSGLWSSPKASIGFERVDQFGGTVGAVALDGGVLFAGVGPRVVALSLDGPSPQVLGTSTLLDGLVTDLEVRAGRVFVITSLGNFSTLDMSNPSASRVLARVALPAMPWDLAVAGDVAFVLTHKGGANTTGDVLTLDVRDPTAPQLLGRAAFDAPVAVASSGSYAVVLDERYGANDGPHLWLVVVDASDPARLRSVGQLDLGGQGFMLGWGGAVAVAEHLVHVVMPGPPGLSIVDISVPTDPRVVGTAEVYGSRLAAAAGHAFVSGADRGGLPPRANDEFWHKVVNTTSPARPAILGEVHGAPTPKDENSERWIMTVAADEQRVVMATGNLIGITRVDASGSELATQVWRAPGSAYAVAVAGNAPARLCTVRETDVIDIVEVAGDSPLSSTGRVDLTPYWSAGAVAAGRVGDRDLVYVAGGRSDPARLGVVDPALPPASALRGFVEVPFSIGRVAGDGDRAVLAVEHYDGLPPDGKYINGVQLIDARDPAAPRLAAFLDSGPRFPSVAVTEGRAFIGTADGLQVYDIRNPDAPTLLATSPAVRGATSLAVAGPLLVAAGTDITLLDVGRPGPPTVRGRIPVAGARQVAMDDNFAYVAFERTVRVYWLRQPWPTSPAAEIDLAAEIWDIAAGPLPGEVVVAAASAGLYRLRMPRRPPTPLQIWLPLIRFD